MWFRFIVATIAVGVVSVLSILVLFFGAGLNTVQVGLLTLLVSSLISEIKTASGYLFDGTPSVNKEVK